MNSLRADLTKKYFFFKAKIILYIGSEYFLIFRFKNHPTMLFFEKEMS